MLGVVPAMMLGGPRSCRAGGISKQGLCRTSCDVRVIASLQAAPGQRGLGGRVLLESSHLGLRVDGPSGVTRWSRPSRAFQHYDDRHSHGGPPERHGRDSRDGWGGYGSDKRMSEARGLPPPPR